MTETTTPIEAGTGTTFNSPMPRSFATSASPTCRRRKKNADQNRVHKRDAEIIGPPPSSPDRLFAPGSDHFPQGHHSKNAAKGG